MDFKPDEAALTVLRQLAKALADGEKNFSIQASPHPVLLRDAFYESDLKPLIARWALVYVKNQAFVQQDTDKAVRLGAAAAAADGKDAAAATVGAAAGTLPDLSGLSPLVPTRTQSVKPAAPRAYSPQEVDANLFGYVTTPMTAELTPAQRMVKDHYGSDSTKLLNLTRDWVCSFMPHIISKINRVGYGLLHKEDIDRWSASEGKKVEMPKTRELLAVPFIGKDVPSRSSEFAHPEVLIGLSVLAARYEGLRRENVLDVVTQLKKQVVREPGPFSERPSRILFGEWLNLSKRARAHKVGYTGELAEWQDELDVLPLELFQVSPCVFLTAFSASADRCIALLRSRRTSSRWTR